MDEPSLRDRKRVFTDRQDAGERLASALEPLLGRQAVVLAIPAGGVPVAAVVTRRLNLLLDVAVTSKVTYAFEPEAGYGAVAFDGSVLLRDDLIRRAGLAPAQVEADVRRARRRVERRLQRLRGDRPWPPISGRVVCVVDDGLATGLTMQATLRALRRMGVQKLIVAAPTGHADAAARLTHDADRVVCLNIRSQSPFAVADAYQQWRDVDESEVIAQLKEAQEGRAA
ncbi:MAG TPA: phosphoribosyltransferase family protein [Phycisphaeraceae bacterium]